MAKQCFTCQRVNFSVGLEIGACWRMEKYFSARLPPEGRLERDAHVGVLVDWNGGCRKKLQVARYSGDDCGLCDDCNVI